MLGAAIVPIHAILAREWGEWCPMRDKLPNCAPTRRERGEMHARGGRSLALSTQRSHAGPHLTGSRWSATPATTSATPVTSGAVGTCPSTAIPITVAVAGSSETMSA